MNHRQEELELGRTIGLIWQEENESSVPQITVELFPLLSGDHISLTRMNED